MIVKGASQGEPLTIVSHRGRRTSYIFILLLSLVLLLRRKDLGRADTQELRL
jgi:hypothetical protein